MKKMIEEIKKRKEIILYLFFGACTTLVNIVCYFVLRNLFSMGITYATAVSWFISVLFAYFTNKIFVFESKKGNTKALIVEFSSFVSGRIFTGLMDLVIMLITVDVLNFNEPLMKIISNIAVIVINYILSKIWIFKK